MVMRAVRLTHFTYWGLTAGRVCTSVWDAGIVDADRVYKAPWGPQRWQGGSLFCLPGKSSSVSSLQMLLDLLSPEREKEKPTVTN